MITLVTPFKKYRIAYIPFVSFEKHENRLNKLCVFWQVAEPEAPKERKMSLAQLMNAMQARAQSDSKLKQSDRSPSTYRNFSNKRMDHFSKFGTSFKTKL